MSSRSFGRSGHGWWVYALTAPLIVVAVMVLQLIDRGFSLEFGLWSAPPVVVHALVLARAVYRPMVRRWGIGGWLAQFLIAPVSLVATWELFVRFFIGPWIWPGVITFMFTPVLWLALLVAGWSEFYRVGDRRTVPLDA